MILKRKVVHLYIFHLNHFLDDEFDVCCIRLRYIDMFFDDETTKFKLKFLGREDIKTKFGKVSCMMFRPYVQAGRVFKEDESLTVWISDDKNKLPLKVQASLAVGSLKAELEKYKGLKHPLVKK